MTKAIGVDKKQAIRIIVVRFMRLKKEYLFLDAISKMRERLFFFDQNQVPGLERDSL